MSIRKGFFSLVLGLVGLSLVLSSWRFVSLMNQETDQQNLSQAEREVTFVRQLANLTVQSWLDKVIMAASREQTARQMGASSQQDEGIQRALGDSGLLAVGLLKREADGKWSVSHQRTQLSMSGRWPENFVKSLFVDLPFESVLGDKSVFVKVSDPQSSPLFLLLTEVRLGNENQLAFGILPSTAFQTVSEAFLGSGVEFAVINDRGFALAYSEQAYVGANLADSHPAVSDLLRRREISSVGFSQNRQKQAMATASARLGDANLYVMSGQVQASRWAMIPRFLFTILFIALALTALGFGYSYLKIQPLEHAITYLSRQLTSVAEGRPVVFFAQGNPILDPLKAAVERLITKENGEAPAFIQEATHNQVESSRLGAYKEMSVGLAQALKEPLAAVLAQAQLARAKAGHEDMKDHFVVIERETRRARETIEDLLRLSGAESSHKGKLEFQDVLLQALATHKGRIQGLGVRVLKDIDRPGAIEGQVAQVQTIIEEVLKNSLEAMGKSSEKMLKISTENGDDRLRLVVEDSGVGIGKEQLGRVFDPFFTTKAQDNHKGLGLTVAKGIMKSLGGHLTLESLGEGKGTRATLEFPLVAKGIGESDSSQASISALRPTDDSHAPVDLSRPITGTLADELPTPPAADELTLTGVQIRPPKIKGTES